MVDNVGEYTYGAQNILVKRWDSPTNPHCLVTIGKFCSIADNIVMFTNGNHHYTKVSTYPFAELGWMANTAETTSANGKGPIIIGNDVWIGSHTIIMSGVTIGSGAIIGAYSVVAKNVEPYEIVAGNPIKHIRYRFPKETISKLLELKWWDWSIDRIKEALPLLTKSDNCIAFIESYYK